MGRKGPSEGLKIVISRKLLQEFFCFSNGFNLFCFVSCDVDAAIKAVESSIYVDSDLRQSDAEPTVTPVAQLLTTENDTREAEKDTSRPSESIKTGSGEKDELPFDVLYSKCRTEARVRTALRNQLLKKAAASYVQQNYHMTEHYTNEVITRIEPIPLTAFCNHSSVSCNPH